MEQLYLLYPISIYHNTVETAFVTALKVPLPVLETVDSPTMTETMMIVDPVEEAEVEEAKSATSGA